MRIRDRRGGALQRRHASLMGVQPGSHCGGDVQAGLQRQDEPFQSIGCCLPAPFSYSFYWSDGVPHMDVQPLSHPGTGTITTMDGGVGARKDLTLLTGVQPAIRMCFYRCQLFPAPTLSASTPSGISR
jgi:hypothetical protein